jgi:hypothetical protein
MPRTYTFSAAVARKEYAGIERIDHLAAHSETKLNYGIIIFAGWRCLPACPRSEISIIPNRYELFGYEDAERKR